MFIGHFGVGFASKRIAPRASLGTLLVAPLLPDILWPIFLLAGWERVRIDPGNTAFTPLAFESYPISHSLVTTIGWAAVFALVYWARTHYVAGTSVVGLGVLSHWFLDALVHRPDLPLYPGGQTFVGLGLWNSVAGTLVVEGGLFAAGVWLYVATTRARDRTGTLALWSFIAVLVLLYLGDAVGPPPPSARALALVQVAGALLPVWAWWLDRHRIVAVGRS